MIERFKGEADLVRSIQKWKAGEGPVGEGLRLQRALTEFRNQYEARTPWHRTSHEVREIAAAHPHLAKQLWTDMPEELVRDKDQSRVRENLTKYAISGVVVLALVALTISGRYLVVAAERSEDASSGLLEVRQEREEFSETVEAWNEDARRKFEFLNEALLLQLDDEPPEQRKDGEQDPNPGDDDQPARD